MSFEIAKKHFLDGLNLLDMKRYEEAEFHFLESLNLMPDRISTLINLSATQIKLKKFSDAKKYSEKAIELDNSCTEALINLGVINREQGKFIPALEVFEVALKLKPDYYEAWANKGIALHELKRYDEALASYDQAISFKPDLYDAYWGKALIQLALGNFKDGLKNYEYRLERTSAYPKRHQEFPLLTNLNQASGKRVLVWSEQGHGDTIQFSRFIKNLNDLNIDIIFEVQAGLKTLLEQSIKHAKVICEGTPFGRVDFQIPLMSLPLLLELDIHDIQNDPYLEDSKEDSIFWKKNLSVANNKLNIGIACSGNEQHINDKNRSIDLKFFQPIADQANLFLIQKDLRKKDQDFLRAHPEIKFLGEEIKSFNDSASIIQAMDLIITVDTSLAHLSGALGKSTLILIPRNPEWRWLLDRQDSPWYPTAKIFRQPHSGHWETVIEDIVLYLNLNHLR